MKSHLISSPWITLNKQYCVEYLGVFLKQVEVHGGIPDARKTDLLEDTLQLTNNRFNIAAAHTGTKVAKEALFPHMKGICSNYYYECSWFERGFGKTERRRRPTTKDWFVEPVEMFRRYHEEYNIPASRLSIDIWYGDPSWSVKACLQEVDKEQPYHSVISLRPLHAKILVNDYDASIATIDGEIEVLREAFGKIIEKMRIRYPKPDQLGHIQELEMMVERDLVWLRESHLRVIVETTNFWKARNGWYDLEDTFRIAENPHEHQENTTALENHYETTHAPIAISTSNALQRLPREIRDLVFEFAIQDYPDSEFLGEPQRNNKNYSVLKHHLLNAPCLTLNKQYCTEYLTVLLRNLESGVGAQDAGTLDHCLRLIDLLFTIVGDIEHTRERLCNHIKGISIHQHTHGRYRQRDGVDDVNEMQEHVHLELADPTRTLVPLPLEQLYRLHQHYHIPVDKISINLDYGNPTHCRRSLPLEGRSGRSLCCLLRCCGTQRSGKDTR
ncbi:hypothetical protein KCU65_g1591, partial [Aureobasidium melanogenum]